MTSALKFPKNCPVPGRDHATHMLQKKKIHEISCLRSRSLDPGRDHVCTFCKKPKIYWHSFLSTRNSDAQFHNAKWIMPMIEFRWCKTLILMIHALVLAWYENHTMKTRLRAREIPMLKFHYAKWIMKSIAIQWRIQNRKHQNPKRNTLPSRVRPGTGACFLFGF